MIIPAAERFARTVRRREADGVPARLLARSVAPSSRDAFDLESPKQKNHFLQRVRLSFRLDLAFHGLYKARTSRQAVSNASVGTDHPLN
jgi:hypothetical protein